QKNVLAGGTATLDDAYGQVVARIGTRTQAARSDADTQAALFGQAQQRRDSVSGVNLDEEAAALLKYQQAYQAAAQVIATADHMFQTLLDATRRQIMRLSTAEFSRLGMNAILDQQASLLHTQRQLSASKRILEPADDPSGSALASRLQTAIDRTA